LSTGAQVIPRKQDQLDDVAAVGAIAAHMGKLMTSARC
jgi:hypothetical protein